MGHIANVKNPHKAVLLHDVFAGRIALTSFEVNLIEIVSKVEIEYRIAPLH